MELIKQIANEFTNFDIGIYDDRNLTVGDLLADVVMLCLAEKAFDLIKSAGYVPKWKECPSCDGTGMPTIHRPVYMQASVGKCPTCNGTGQVRAAYTVEEVEELLKQERLKIANEHCASNVPFEERGI